MRHRLAGVALSVALVATLTACTPPDGDPALIAQWREDRRAEIEPDSGVIAVLSSNASARQENDLMEASLDESSLPTRITFDCFGDGSIALQVESSAATGTGSATTTITTLGAFRCPDGPHEIDPASLGEAPISRVGAVTGNADRNTAWILTVRGNVVSS